MDNTDDVQEVFSEYVCCSWSSVKAVRCSREDTSSSSWLRQPHWLYGEAICLLWHKKRLPAWGSFSTTFRPSDFFLPVESLSSWTSFISKLCVNCKLWLKCWYVQPFLQKFYDNLLCNVLEPPVRSVHECALIYRISN